MYIARDLLLLVARQLD